jgi:hypothetical protein
MKDYISPQIIGGEHTEEMPSSKVSTRFIEPMLLHRADSLPDDATSWTYELKHDGHLGSH